MMRITVLMENTAEDPCLYREHGLSLYIETGERRILFDMGQTDAFAQNAEALGVDLAAVDLAVLSHGHYDHGGGLPRFLEINSQAQVYISPAAMEPHYHGRERYIGLDPRLWQETGLRRRLVETKGCAPMPLGDDLELHPCEDRMLINPVDAAGLTVMREGELIPEDFCHEQYLLIREKGKKILFSGCSHRGIRNIVHWLQPDVLIGGFHFSKLDPEGEGKAILDQAAEDLLRQDCVYYTCHCTGEKQYHYLKEQMGEKLQYLRTGYSLEL